MNAHCKPHESGGRLFTEWAERVPDVNAGADDGGYQERDVSTRDARDGRQPLADAVEVWRVELDAIAAETVSALAQTLSADERGRGERFRFERDRRNFVVTRGVLRSLLAQHVESTPREITFRYGPAGKPFVAEPAGGGGLYFNVTHSGNLTLIAITRAGEVGIDVEPVRSLPDWEGVADLVFDPKQVARLRSLAEPVRMPAFFEAWTRKEAIVKARGTGLGGSGHDTALVVSTFTFSPNWVASIAAPPGVRVLTCQGWDGSDRPTFRSFRLRAPDSAVSL